MPIAASVEGTGKQKSIQQAANIKTQRLRLRRGANGNRCTKNHENA